MSGTTPRVGLYTPADDGSEPIDVATDLNDNLELLDATIGFVPSTSAIPPSTTFDGMATYETDTNKVKFLKGMTWTQILSAGATFVGNVLLDTASRIGIGIASPAALIDVVVSSITSVPVLKVKQTSEAFNRMQLDHDGIRFGGGIVAPEVRLYRPTSNQLSITGSVSMSNDLSVTGTTSLATTSITGNLTLDGDLSGDFNVTGNFTAQGVGARVYVRKSSDTSRSNSITPVADPHLTVPVVANGVYIVEIVGFANGIAAADFRGSWGVPSGSGGYKLISGPENASANRDATLMRASGQGPTVEIGYGLVGASTPISFHEKGIIRVGATPGNIVFNWAQVSTNATVTTLMTDSFMIVTRVE